MVHHQLGPADFYKLMINDSQREGRGLLGGEEVDSEAVSASDFGLIDETHTGAEMPSINTYELHKRILKVLNAIYMLVGISLIAVGGWAKASQQVSSLNIVGAVVACGVFLLLISIYGYIAAHRHRMAMLFFYMVVMGLLVLVQTVVAGVIFTMSDEGRQKALIESGWASSSDVTKDDVQRHFTCCGLHSVTGAAPYGPGPNCPGSAITDNRACYPSLLRSLQTAEMTASWFCLVFAILELIGIFVAHRFRNQKNPKANIEAFQMESRLLS